MSFAKNLLSGPNSARRNLRERPTDTKRQKSDETRPSEGGGTFNVVAQIRASLNKIEVKLDKIFYGLEECLLKDKVSFVRADSNETGDRKVTSDMGALFQDLIRIEKKVDSHSETEELVLNIVTNHKTETQKLDKILEEVRMERDVLLEKVHAYLEQISSLKSKLEEQRCTAGAYERQVSAVYENQIRKLETENEELRNVSVQKEKQLKDANEQLQQLNTMLKSHESHSWEKKNEEYMYISILKNDLETTRNEKIKMEEEFKRLKRLCGYTEQDLNLGRDESLRTILRRSKSMSNLTVQDSAAEVVEVESSGVGNREQRDQALAPFFYHRTPKSSPEECGSAEVTNKIIPRQKMFQDLTLIEKGLFEPAEEVKQWSDKKAKTEEGLPEEEPQKVNASELHLGLDTLTLKLENLREQLKQCEN